ncbi:MAG TPA: SLBB domain-containing protein [Pyrinomonadaceae bacterium]|nr:SLBB domain-containing protein [Pyrinomonadaceae bacterium]
MKALKINLFFGILVLIFGQIIVNAQENKTNPSSAETPITSTSATPVVQELSGNNEKYRIGLQDTLEIQVLRNSKLELLQKVDLNTDGTITLPRIEGKVVAVCKTERELADELVKKFNVYLKNPYVNVKAVEQRSQPVAVIGAVEKPGPFFLDRRLTLLELLSRAGGPDVQNAGSTVQVARLGNSNRCGKFDNSNANGDEVQFLAYKIADVQKGITNPEMMPGDIVSVLVADEAFVVGNVIKPTKILLRERRTLTQAIADAGGVNSTAKTDKVFIQRSEPNSKIKTELAFNLKEIRNGKIADPELQANDVVVVGNDNLKSARDGILGVLKTAVPFIFF